MITREQLHQLLAELPECDLHMAELLIQWRHELRDNRMLVTLATAPLDDEPETSEEAAAVAEAREAIARGDVYSMEEIKREFGL
ncbi:MAG: hypothetical protein AB7R89_15615 [Dehalococcoidia bacterium]